MSERDVCQEVKMGTGSDDVKPQTETFQKQKGGGLTVFTFGAETVKFVRETRRGGALRWIVR